MTIIPYHWFDICTLQQTFVLYSGKPSSPLSQIPYAKI